MGYVLSAKAEEYAPPVKFWFDASEPENLFALLEMMIERMQGNAIVQVEISNEDRKDDCA